MTWHSEYGDLLVALLLGMAIGWERSLEGKPAGYRTHGLVALGAAGIVLAVRVALERYPGQEHYVIHAIAGVITGIGFLGAGAILQSESERQVLGLTTAATIWIVASVGVVCGLGQVALAVVMSLLAWVVLRAFVRLEEVVFPTKQVRNAEGKVEKPASTGKPTDAED